MVENLISQGVCSSWGRVRNLCSTPPTLCCFGKHSDMKRVMENIVANVPARFDKVPH